MAWEALLSLRKVHRPAEVQHKKALCMFPCNVTYVCQQQSASLFVLVVALTGICNRALLAKAL